MPSATARLEGRKACYINHAIIMPNQRRIAIICMSVISFAGVLKKVAHCEQLALGEYIGAYEAIITCSSATTVVHGGVYVCRHMCNQRSQYV